MTNPAARAPIKLLIVDDHPIVLHSLVSLLTTYGPPVQVVAQARGAEEALVLAEQSQPDIVLTDLRMHPTSGITLIERLSARQPGIRYVVFTASTQEEHMLQAFDAGAAGFVVKESEVEVIVQAIEAVMGGSTHYPAGLMRALERRQQQPSLTAREAEVLALVAQGLTSKEIARFLGIDFRTVDAHRANIRQRFHLDSSAALLRFAMENRKN
ncbi:MAG: response regulator transcription factor [Rhodoferax sp.]|uniref:response regulator transcription factor n=1 Tax=Rhodoferax sp. TaxID=50421 RepID=UPI0032652268